MKRTSPTMCPGRCARRRCGYTLIELLLVVAILGLAGALLVPSLGEPDTLKAQGAVRRLIADLSFAQSDALAQQQQRRVHFYDGGRGYVLLRPPFDPELDYITDPLARGGDEGAYIVDFSADKRFEGLSISSVNIDGGQRFISYDELGGTITELNGPGTGGTIILESPNSRFQITIAPFTGKLTVQEL